MRKLIFLLFFIFFNYAKAYTPFYKNIYLEIENYGLTSEEEKHDIYPNVYSKSKKRNSYPKHNQRLFGHSFCRHDLLEGCMPQCVNIGTKGEGWLYKNYLVRWSNCSQEEIFCLHEGTYEEGWYFFSKK